MTTGEIVAIAFLVVMVGLIIWKTRGHKGPIRSDRNDVGYSGGDHPG